MPNASPSAAARLWQDYGAKLIKYAGVSVVSTTLSLILLTLFNGVFGWSFVWSNVAAVTISTIPAYVLSRRWVWTQEGPNSLRYEIIPFWAMAFFGLGLSTLFVFLAEKVSDHLLVLFFANGAAFGLLWLVKFFILDKYMWANQPALAESTPA